MCACQTSLFKANREAAKRINRANERCDGIGKLPRNEMSIDQSMFFAKNRSLAAGYRIEPGL